MVKVRQGDIIKLNFDPQSGHEQSGYRPALVISNDVFHKKTNLVIVCPISNTPNKFPLHVKLDDRTVTTGSVLCQHVKSLDINSRGYVFVEHTRTLEETIYSNGYYLNLLYGCKSKMSRQIRNLPQETNLL